MAGGTKVGSAYVEVSPKASGNFKALIEKEMPSGTDGGSKFGGGFSQGMSGAISAGAVAVGNILADVVQSGASMAKDLIGDALTGFSDFEQLSGGVEKLFGEEAAKTVMDNASAAFASAGMSANEYMEQATSFSASLIGSLGGDTARAAELADVAMRAMSDNVNVFGSDMTDVQNAFQGFAKQNYTMLDNLKLGYGGTKGEMQRLIDDANAYAAANGQAADLSIESFGDIVQAIQLVQEKQNIAGTTAREAATTVEGSVNMMKGAWSNWVAGLGRDGADMGKLTGDLVDSATKAAENVLPRVTQIVGTLASALPGLVQQLAPAVMPAAGSLIESVVTLVSTLATETLPALLPQFVAGATSLVQTIVPSLVGMLPYLAMGAMQLFGGILQGLAAVVPQIAAMLPSVVLMLGQGIAAGLPTMLSSAIQLFYGIPMGLAQALPGIVGALVTVLPLLAQQVVGALPQMAQAAGQLFGQLVRSLGEIVPQLVEGIVYVVTHIPEIISGAAGMLFDAGKGLFEGFVNGLTGQAPAVDQAASGMAAGASAAALGSADGTLAGQQLSETMMAGFDFTGVEQATASGVATATDNAAKAVDASAISEQLMATATGSLDTAHMDPQATLMATNAVEAAKSVDATQIGAQFSAQAAEGIDVNAMSAKAAEMAANLNASATVSVRADLSGVNALKSGAASVQASVSQMQSAVSASMAGVSRAASAAAPAFGALATSVASAMARSVASARTAAAGISAAMRIPDFTARVHVAAGSVTLPHFSMKGSFDPKTGAVPSVNVAWYARGGIFPAMSPQIIGVGDARVPEVVTPIDRLASMLRDLGVGGGSGDTYNVYMRSDRDDGAGQANDFIRRIRAYKLANGGV